MSHDRVEPGDDAGCDGCRPTNQEVVGRVDDLQGGARPARDQWSNDIWRSELVVRGDEHEGRLVAGTFDRDDAERRRNRDSGPDPVMLEGHADGGPERVADEDQRQIGLAGLQHLEPRLGVTASELDVVGWIRSHAEVETKRVDAGGGERLEDAGNHRMVPIATEARVWMEDDGSATRLRDRDQVDLQRTAVCRRHGDGGGLGVHAGRRYSRRVPSTPNEKLPIKMLNDRLLVRIPDKDGERRTQGGILIPATAQMAKRLVWAEVVALGVNVRSAEVGDLVLFSPEDRYEVEVQGSDFIMLRERDLHAVAASRIEASTGLYL